MSNTTRWLLLEPVDAWFFRDGYPFNAGEDQGVRDTIFPPYPPTVVGAVRAGLARANGWNQGRSWPDSMNETLGDGFDNLGTLSFQGPFLCRKGQLLFPMPLHVAGHTHVENGKRRFEPVAFLGPSKEPMTCDLGEVRVPVLPKSAKPSAANKHPKPPENFFVTKKGMERILAGDLPDGEDCVPAEALYSFESRIGIKRGEETHTTGDASMYAPRYVRLADGVSLAVAVSGIPADWKLPRLMPMGGESRLAACSALETPPVFPKPPAAAGKSLLIALTPCSFPGDSWWGAGPGGNAGQLAASLKGQVVCAAVDRPLGIGGWDFKHGPRPMEPHVAPGAVWWLDNAEAAGDVIEPLGDKHANGFGMALAGAWTGNE